MDMDASIVVSIITGLCSVAGVIVTAFAQGQKIRGQLDVTQAVMNTKLESLTDEVRRHNNFAQRIPVIEEQIKVANHRIDDLERAKDVGHHAG